MEPVLPDGPAPETLQCSEIPAGCFAVLSPDQRHWTVVVLADKSFVTRQCHCQKSLVGRQGKVSKLMWYQFCFNQSYYPNQQNRLQSIIQMINSFWFEISMQSFLFRLEPAVHWENTFGYLASGGWLWLSLRQIYMCSLSHCSYRRFGFWVHRKDKKPCELGEPRIGIGLCQVCWCPSPAHKWHFTSSASSRSPSTLLSQQSKAPIPCRSRLQWHGDSLLGWGVAHGKRLSPPRIPQQGRQDGPK